MSKIIGLTVAAAMAFHASTVCAGHEQQPLSSDTVSIFDGLTSATREEWKANCENHLIGVRYMGVEHDEPHFVDCGISAGTTIIFSVPRKNLCGKDLGLDKKDILDFYPGTHLSDQNIKALRLQEKQTKAAYDVARRELCSP